MSDGGGSGELSRVEGPSGSMEFDGRYPKANEEAICCAKAAEELRCPQGGCRRPAQTPGNKVLALLAEWCRTSVVELTLGIDYRTRSP